MSISLLRMNFRLSSANRSSGSDIAMVSVLPLALIGKMVLPSHTSRGMVFVSWRFSLRLFRSTYG